MTTITARLVALTFLFIGLLGYSNIANAREQGIYLTQTTAEQTQRFDYLLHRSINAGITTFIIDLEEKPTKSYIANVAKLKPNNIKYIARITMFPGGGSTNQIKNDQYWQRKYKLIQMALDYGASEIQMDYIRYNTSSGSSAQHAKDVYKIINWYKQKLASQNIPLQIDVFGISSFGEETHIGQNVKMFSQTIDTLCPMVYPSHYVPFREHFETPYNTIKTSLDSIKDQFDDKMPIKLIPYIELSNYHFYLSGAKKLAYIRAQIKAVHDAGADGWYAWSAHNQYDSLFNLLESEKHSQPQTASAE